MKLHVHTELTGAPSRPSSILSTISSEVQAVVLKCRTPSHSCLCPVPRPAGTFKEMVQGHSGVGETESFCVLHCRRFVEGGFWCVTPPAASRAAVSAPLRLEPIWRRLRASQEPIVLGRQSMLLEALLTNNSSAAQPQRRMNAFPCSSCFPILWN